MVAEIAVAKVLDDFGIEYIIKEHPDPAFTCEEVAHERDIRLSQVLKCMVGKDARDNVYVMLIPGDKLLKIQKVRNLSGGIKINLFHPVDLSAVFGVTVGAISPVQFLGIAKFYLDRTVLLEDIIDISSGSPYAGIHLKSKDLVCVVEPIVCDIISNR